MILLISGKGLKRKNRNEEMYWMLGKMQLFDGSTVKWFNGSSNQQLPRSTTQQFN
jgi:hypothetical protein